MLRPWEDLGATGASRRDGVLRGPARLGADAQALREQGHGPAAVPETPEGPWALAAARLSAVRRAPC